MQIFDYYRRANAGLAKLLQWLLILVFGLLVVDVLWGVATRHLLGRQASWSEELARLLMVWLALLGSALACREARHLGLDAVVRQWPQDLQRIARLLVGALVMGFALIIMAWGGYSLVSQRFTAGQTLPALGISKGWFYLALPVAGVLITLFESEAIVSVLRGEDHMQERTQEKEVTP